MKSMTRIVLLLSLVSLSLAACKTKGETDAPDELELPPEREVPREAKADDDADKPKPGKQTKPEQVEPSKPAVVAPQDRDPNQEKSKMARSRKLSAQAKQLLRAGKGDQAISEARKALREHEQNVEAMLVIAEVFYKQGKHELVQSVANSILKVDAKVLTPNEKSQAYNLMGFAYLQVGQRRDAFNAFKNAAETDDKNASAWNNLGVQYMWRGDYPTAESCFEYATTLDSKFAEAFLNWGAALRANGKLAEAEKAFLDAGKLRANWAEVHFNLGVLYLDGESFPGLEVEKRYQQAIQQFERYKSLVAQGNTTLERGTGKRRGPTDAMGNELVSLAQADLYIKAANKGIESEQRRKEREEKRKQKEGEEAEAPATSEPTPEQPTPSEPAPSEPAKPGEQPSPAQPQKPGQSQPPAEQPTQPPAEQPSKPPAEQPSKPAPSQPQQPQKPGQQKPSQPPAEQPSPPPAEQPSQPQAPKPQKPKTQKPGGG